MKTAMELRYVLYTVGLVGCTALERVITKGIERDDIIFHLISGGVLVILAIMSTTGIKHFLESELFAKLFYRKSFIGGRWIEIVADDKGDFHHYNILDIHHGAYNILLEGTCFKKDLRYDYKFVSLHTTLEGNLLSYTYIQKDESHEAKLDIGMLNFFSHDTKCFPDEYFGNYRAYIPVEQDGVESTLAKQKVFSLRGFKLGKNVIDFFDNIDFDGIIEDTNATLNYTYAKKRKKIDDKKRKIKTSRKKKNNLNSKELLKDLMVSYKNIVCNADAKNFEEYNKSKEGIRR